MIVFTPLRTPRLNVRLNELSIHDAIYLCRMRPDMNEAGTSEMLARVVEPDAKPRVGQVIDPRLWTVQERAMVVAHYLVHLNPDNPDFTLGDARFSDYLLEERNAPPERVELGTVADDEWHLYPLLGAHAESIERLILSGRLPPGRHGWWLGAMGAMLVRARQDVPFLPLVTREGKPFRIDDVSDAAIDEHIAARASIFDQFPETAFMDLLYAFVDGVRRLDHLFRLDFSEDGVVFMPVREVPGNAPARFPFGECVTERTAAVFGNAPAASA